MARDNIIQYVKGYHTQGYSSVQIRVALRNGGVQDDEIEEALHAAGISTSTSPLIWILAVLGVLVVITASAYYFLMPSVPETLLVKITPVSKTVQAGGVLSFSHEFIRTGSKAQDDIAVSYRVQDSKKSVIASLQESVRLANKGSGVSSMSIPEASSAGSYILLAEARSSSVTAKSSFSFQLTGKQKEPARYCVAGCDDFNQCTLDVCKEGSCSHEALSPCCGNSICEQGESTESCAEDCRSSQDAKQDSMALVARQAQVLARKSATDAVALCKSLARDSDEDACLLDVAKISMQSSVCEQVQDQKGRDSCFMDFVVNKDEFALCDKIVDIWLKNSCVSYQRLKSA